SLLRRAPAAFAGDQFVLAAPDVAHHDRLDQALRLDRCGESVKRGFLEMTAWLVLPGADRRDRKVAQGFARGSRGGIGIRVAEQYVEVAGTEAPAFGCAHADTFMMGVRGVFGCGFGLATAASGAASALRAAPSPSLRIISPASPR